MQCCEDFDRCAVKASYGLRVYAIMHLARVCIFNFLPDFYWCVAFIAILWQLLLNVILNDYLFRPFYHLCVVIGYVHKNIDNALFNS